MQCAAFSQVPMENLKQSMVFTSCMTSWGSCFENVFSPCVSSRGFVKGTVCHAQLAWMWCEVFFNHIYMFTPASPTRILWKVEITYVCAVYVSVWASEGKKQELTRLESERHHLPGEGYISGVDVKVSKSIQERLIMGSLWWPVSFHRQGDTCLSCLRLGHCT